MPFTSWLCTLLTKRTPAPTKTAEPDSPEIIDNSVRMHIAAHDPAFPAKREAAVATITAAIDAVAQAHGFDKKAKSWAKAGTLGTVSIHLQRSRYGFDCHINLGFQPLTEEALGPWAQDDFVALERFFTMDSGIAEHAAVLTYLDVHEDAATLTETLRILSEQALPWLLAHLEDPMAYNQPMQPERGALA